MSTYTPDKFVLIDYSPVYPPKERYAILAGFYGGFAGSNSWKRSISIASVEVGSCGITTSTLLTQLFLRAMRVYEITPLRLEMISFFLVIQTMQFMSVIMR